MHIKKILSGLVSAIMEEASRNEAFRASLERAIGGEHSRPILPEGPAPSIRGAGTRKGRRTPAVLDPVELARQGEDVLRRELGALNLEQLRDVVAQHGMDPGKLVMKWKDANRITARIVELALARARKGDAFRSD